MSTTLIDFEEQHKARFLVRSVNYELKGPWILDRIELMLVTACAEQTTQDKLSQELEEIQQKLKKLQQQLPAETESKPTEPESTSTDKSQRWTASKRRLLIWLIKLKIRLEA